MKRIIVNFIGLLAGAGGHLDFWKQVRLMGVRHIGPLTEKNLIRNISLDISAPSRNTGNEKVCWIPVNPKGHFESGSVEDCDFGVNPMYQRFV